MYEWHTFNPLNPAELNYHPFMISIDKCNGSCNVVDDLSMKIRATSETKKRYLTWWQEKMK